MTLSEKAAIQHLTDIMYKEEEIDINFIAFALTVVRDNYGSDPSGEIVKMMLRKIWLQENMVKSSPLSNKGEQV